MNAAAPSLRPPEKQQALERLLGLAVFGEKVAAKTYTTMAEIRPEFGDVLRKFAAMEGRHGAAFAEVARRNDAVPDRAFADGELGYLIEQVDEYGAAQDFDALAVVQGFIVESLAIATYEAFLPIADDYVGAREAFSTAAADERYHVDWIVRYLRLRYFDCVYEFSALATRVNGRGVDCIGGTMLNIAGALDQVGMRGAACAGAMADGYALLLERVGVERRPALAEVVRQFAPLLRKHRSTAHPAAS